MALLFKQAPKSKGEIAREKAAAAAKVARVVRPHLQIERHNLDVLHLQC